ncbi:MAG TPA: J domain-containing protein, partial [Gaiellaceae bacterium]
MNPPDGTGAVRNPYEVLGVSPNASLQEIRDAYWRLVRFYRMESDPADPWTPSHLEEVQGAYELLSDPARRAELDAADGGAAAVGAARPEVLPAEPA